MSLSDTITLHQLIVLEIVQFIGMVVTIVIVHGVRTWRLDRERRQFQRDWNEFVGRNAEAIISGKPRHG